MRFNKLVAMAFTVSLLSGCGSAAIKLSTIYVETSKYNPINTTKSEVNNYFDLIEKSESQVVNDKLGSYFYKKEKEGVFSRFSLLNEDGLFLRRSLSKTIGLMEPIYSFDSDAKYHLDKNETKKIYYLFTKNMGLKLLPLEKTWEYHNEIVRAARNKAKSVYQSSFKSGLAGVVFSTMKITSSTVKGEFGLYSPKYYNSILNKISNDAEYLISSGGPSEYFYEKSNDFSTFPKSHVNPKKDRKKGVIYYDSLMRKINRVELAAFNFIPSSYFETLKSGGALRYYSGCQLLSKDYQIEKVDSSNRVVDSSYFDGITFGAKNNNKENIKINLARKRFYTALDEFYESRRLVVSSCKDGFKKVGLSGAIESKKLR